MAAPVTPRAEVDQLRAELRLLRDAILEAFELPRLMRWFVRRLPL